MINPDSIFYWLAINFTGERYIFYTTNQGIIWSLADIILVLALLLIADSIRRVQERKRIKIRYGLLAFTALTTPLLLFAQTPARIFYIESIVCGLQFLILVFTLITDSRSAVRYVETKRVRSAESE